MSHDAQSSKYKHNIGGGPAPGGMGNGNPMGGMGMGGGMGGGMNPMGGMGNGMGGGVAAGGFDPNAMAAMYQKMMMSKFIPSEMQKPSERDFCDRHEHVEPDDDAKHDEPK
jgi:hypothetical protein